MTAFTPRRLVLGRKVDESAVRGRRLVDAPPCGASDAMAGSRFTGSATFEAERCPKADRIRLVWLDYIWLFSIR